MNESHRRGMEAERRAAAFLETRGLKVLARNLSCRGGEIDIVALDHDVLVIVEVRQRTSAKFGGALSSVNPRKQRRIIRAVRYFSQSRPAWRSRTLRFDVIAMGGIALAAAPDGPLWIKDACRTV